MKKFWIILAICWAMSPSVFAQDAELTPQQAQKILDEKFLTPEVKKSTTAIKKHINYVANNYDEARLRKIIRNMEKTEIKVAQSSSKKYTPYDRIIRLKEPSDVERYFRKRLELIY